MQYFVLPFCQDNCQWIRFPNYSVNIVTLAWQTEICKTTLKLFLQLVCKKLWQALNKSCIITADYSKVNASVQANGKLSVLTYKKFPLGFVYIWYLFETSHSLLLGKICLYGYILEIQSYSFLKFNVNFEKNIFILHIFKYMNTYKKVMPKPKPNIKPKL